MENIIMKLHKMEMNNIKNTSHGEIIFPKNDVSSQKQSQIIGLYGPNGSGKSAAIYALSLLKKIMSGEELPKETFNYISGDKNFANLKFEFTINHNNEDIQLFYEFKLMKNDNLSDFIVTDEIIKTKTNTDFRPIIFLENNYLDDNVFKPQKKYKAIVSKSKNNEIDLRIAKIRSQEKHQSFFFRKETLDILENNLEEKDIKLLQKMRQYAKLNMFVILNEEHSLSSTNITLPFFFRVDSSTITEFGNINVNYGSNFFTIEKYEVLNKIVNQLNGILYEIIPGLSLKVENLGKAISEKGVEGVNAELVTTRKEDNYKIPIKYESDGIKKIISILSSLVSMYNNANVLVAIDELDSAIYEYLLGEILEILSETAKGQLVFTSHNLRPLEILDSKNIYFTSTNKNNRYVQFINVRESNNLRNLYYRQIKLNTNEQKEKFNESINISKVRNSFRKASKVFDLSEKIQGD